MNYAFIRVGFAGRWPTQNFKQLGAPLKVTRIICIYVLRGALMTRLFDICPFLEQIKLTNSAVVL